MILKIMREKTPMIKYIFFLMFNSKTIIKRKITKL